MGAACAANVKLEPFRILPTAHGPSHFALLAWGILITLSLRRLPALEVGEGQERSTAFQSKQLACILHSIHHKGNFNASG